MDVYMVRVCGFAEDRAGNVCMPTCRKSSSTVKCLCSLPSGPNIRLIRTVDFLWQWKRKRHSEKVEMRDLLKGWIRTLVVNSKDAGKARILIGFKTAARPC